MHWARGADHGRPAGSARGVVRTATEGRLRRPLLDWMQRTGDPLAERTPRKRESALGFVAEEPDERKSEPGEAVVWSG